MVAETLQIMERELTEVLPVYKVERFEGLVFKNDLLKFVTERKKELEIRIAERTNEIEKQNELLKENSWMQSHKTRQPLATILGLVNIIDKSSLTESNLEIIGMLEKIAQEIDEVIRTTVIKANSVKPY
jgi:light-regulated signal transduction histidine kinase (bacteriophytochrome)